MKAYRLFVLTLISVAALIVIVIGCKYDVAEPPWNSPPISSIEASISHIVPAQATPGVNTITIHGANLSGAVDTNKVRVVYVNDTTQAIVRDTTYTFLYQGVYFDNGQTSVKATILEITPTTIKVNRPNIASPTCTIKVASDTSLAVAKYSYSIDPVMETFGSFVANVPLGAICMDNTGNLYVTETNNRYLWKVAANGATSQILVGDTANLVLTRPPWDARIGPDGNLYYFNTAIPNLKEIHMVILNPTSIKDSTWYTFPNHVKNVICGDFDANGYLYTGGRRSGIVIIRPDRSRRDDGYYATDTISCMRVFNNYLYVAIRTGIFRHSISDTSLVGTGELVCDLTQGFLPSARPVKAISFSSDGSKLYIGTDSKYPVLVANSTTIPISINQIEVLYQDILSSNCKNFSFGNVLYCILGNAVYKVDVGTTGAPYLN